VPAATDRAETVAFDQAMAGAERTVVRATPAAAFALARERFLAGTKLDMGALAAELGIGRATLYRWTGDRERLLGDIAWAEVKSLIEYFERTTPGKGAKLLERAAGAFVQMLADNAPLQAFLAAEGDFGLRVLTAPDGPLRPRLVAALRDLIAAQESAGDYDPPVAPELLADGIVTLGERFLYHGGDPARNPDPATAREMISLLLREPCPGEKARRK
jgi:AcrR family transcriptional regulator